MGTAFLALLLLCWWGDWTSGKLGYLPGTMYFIRGSVSSWTNHFTQNNMLYSRAIFLSLTVLNVPLFKTETSVHPSQCKGWALPLHCYLKSHVGSQQTSFVSAWLPLLLQGKFTHCLYFLFTYYIKQHKKSWYSTISMSLGLFGERLVVQASTGLDLTLIRQVLLTTWDNWLYSQD